MKLQTTSKIAKTLYKIALILSWYATLLTVCAGVSFIFEHHPYYAFHYIVGGIFMCGSSMILMISGFEIFGPEREQHKTTNTLNSEEMDKLLASDEFKYKP